MRRPLEYSRPEVKVLRVGGDCEVGRRGKIPALLGKFS